MTPFFNDLILHMIMEDRDPQHLVFHSMAFHLTNPPIHMQATAIAESK